MSDDPSLKIIADLLVENARLQVRIAELDKAYTAALKALEDIQKEALGL